MAPSQSRPGNPESAARRVYLMKDLPPEVVAVAFAKTSRSPDPFDVIADELTEAKSAKFHEKWVVGYGHASVAEHAVLSIALENVSILAAKAIEDNRLASYTEKSTRYQIYDPERVYRPVSFAADPELSGLYEGLVTELLTTYIAWSEKAIAFLKREVPRPPDQSPGLYESQMRARACDAIRYLLPTATLTNLGWTINARALAAAIRKLTGSEIAELRDIGTEIKAIATERVPTLLKYVDPDHARGVSAQAVKAGLNLAETERVTTAQPPEVRILRHDPDGLQKLACAVAYENQPRDWTALEADVAGWSDDERIALIRRALAPLGPHAPMPRVFEHLNYLIEITIDYGAWRDIQRHRIGTQTAQEVTPDCGYTMPPLIEQLGLRDAFAALVERSASAYDALHAHHPAESVYALMLAFRKRSLFAWNLREVVHFVKLRASAKGHAAYRQVARDVWCQILQLQPWLAAVVSPLAQDGTAPE